jgi:hypothetical protein
LAVLVMTALLTSGCAARKPVRLVNGRSLQILNCHITKKSPDHLGCDCMDMTVVGTNAQTGAQVVSCR